MQDNEERWQRGEIMNDWKAIVSIISLAVCFLLSPLLFPNSPDISEKLMYAFFAITGIGAGIPVLATGIKSLRGKT